MAIVIPLGVHPAGWRRGGADSDLADSADSGLEHGAVVCGGVFLYLQVEAYLISPRIMARAVSVPAGVAIISGGCRWRALGRAGRTDCYSGGGFHADSGA